MNDTLSDLDRLPADSASAEGPGASADAVAVGAETAATPAPDRALGILALILGIGGIVFQQWLVSVAALVLGVLALRREPASRGFGIAGLVLGVVGAFWWLALLQLGLAAVLPFGLVTGAFGFGL